MRRPGEGSSCAPRKFISAPALSATGCLSTLMNGEKL
jgi:hypothetical protein